MVDLKKGQRTYKEMKNELKEYNDLKKYVSGFKH